MSAEGRVDALTVGGRRRRGVAVLLVHALDAVLRDERLPQHLAVCAVEREHRQAAAAVAGGGEEDLLAPHDRRRVARTGYGDLPLHARGRRPRVGVSGAVGHQSLPRRAAPSRPVAGAVALDLDHPDVLGRRRRGGAEHSRHDEHAKDGGASSGDSRINRARASAAGPLLDRIVQCFGCFRSVALVLLLASALLPAQPCAPDSGLASQRRRCTPARRGFGRDQSDQPRTRHRHVHPEHRARAAAEVHELGLRLHRWRPDVDRHDGGQPVAPRAGRRRDCVRP